MTEELRAVLDQFGMEDEPYGTPPPPGGDAKFAAAVCNSPGMWAPEYLSAAEVNDLAQTPHFLRLIGRIVCDKVQLEGSADAYLAAFSQKLVALESDPDRVRREALSSDEQEISDLERELLSPTLQNMSEPHRRQLTERIEQRLFELRFSRDSLEERSPKALMARAVEQLEFQRAAVQYLCPQASEVGFGPECGPITYPQSGGQKGIVKLHSEGGLSCDEAMAVLNSHWD